MALVTLRGGYMCVYMLHMPRLALHAHKYTSCEEVRRPAEC